MIHIHPFPARMAPEIALEGLKGLPRDSIVLDPMSGSGMVIGTASKQGLASIGYDLDPLACMISRVNGTSLESAKAREYSNRLLEAAQKLENSKITLPWIDQDAETQRYIDFWFAEAQQKQLRILSYLLIAKPFISVRSYLDFLRVCVSRLIITKEPKVSLARDTAHSRPHRTITENAFDIFSALPQSVEHVLSALQPGRIRIPAKSFCGDARQMGRIDDCSIDCIVTSPPYLNAIDYMRGHRLSLVWFGYSIAKLRKIRARSVGAERVWQHGEVQGLDIFFSTLHRDIDENKRRMLRRYFYDLCALTTEANRVLKSNRTATYVIGNSRIKGREIDNAKLLLLAAQRSCFQLCDKYKRKIPENRRYMPLQNSGNTSLLNRMRQEHVMVFKKIE